MTGRDPNEILADFMGQAYHYNHLVIERIIPFHYCITNNLWAVRTGSRNALATKSTHNKIREMNMLLSNRKQSKKTTFIGIHINKSSPNEPIQYFVYEV